MIDSPHILFGEPIWYKNLKLSGFTFIEKFSRQRWVPKLVENVPNTVLFYETNTITRSVICTANFFQATSPPNHVLSVILSKNKNRKKAEIKILRIFPRLKIYYILQIFNFFLQLSAF